MSKTAVFTALEHIEQVIPPTTMSAALVQDSPSSMSALRNNESISKTDAVLHWQEASEHLQSGPQEHGSQ
jgi:hypothetical protein